MGWQSRSSHAGPHWLESRLPLQLIAGGTVGRVAVSACARRFPLILEQFATGRTGYLGDRRRRAADFRPRLPERSRRQARSAC
jgi:hypothetical protein